MRNRYCLQCASDSMQTLQPTMQSVAQPCNMHNNIMHRQDIQETYDFDITPMKYSFIHLLSTKRMAAHTL
jgi:hypothetical protein